MLRGVDRRELTKYITISQVGLEMVVPIVIGVLLDRYLQSSPWGVSIGAILGLMIGLVHLVKLANKDDSAMPTNERSEPPT